jgi:hypothetical protein
MTNGRELYERCWDILVEYVGASKGPRERAAFVMACLDTGPRKLTEFRFCGSLGFGGKFYRSNGKLYVTCYPEDATLSRKRALTKVNQLLEDITPEGGVWGPPE